MDKLLGHNIVVDTENLKTITRVKSQYNQIEYYRNDLIETYTEDVELNVSAHRGFKKLSFFF